jgi:hypothetical protein
MPRWFSSEYEFLHPGIGAVAPLGPTALQTWLPLARNAGETHRKRRRRTELFCARSEVCFRLVSPPAASEHFSTGRRRGPASPTPE